jgi:hypothetical protein
MRYLIEQHFHLCCDCYREYQCGLDCDTEIVDGKQIGSSGDSCFECALARKYNPA